MKIGISFTYLGVWFCGFALRCFHTIPIPFCAFNALLHHPFGFSVLFFFSVFVRLAHGKEEDERVWIATTSTIGVLLGCSVKDDGMGEEGYYEGTSNDGMKGLGKLCVQWGVLFLMFSR